MATYYKITTRKDGSMGAAKGSQCLSEGGKGRGINRLSTEDI